MVSLNTNVTAMMTQRHLSHAAEQNIESQRNLTSGYRINSASDDAAGLQISNTLNVQTRGLDVALRNAQDAYSVAQTAEGAMNECSEILHRMRELAVQAANGTYSGADRVALNAEVVELKNELLRISDTTKFNDVKLINGSFTDTTFEIGYDESPGHAHNLSIESVKPTDLGMWTTTTQLEKTLTVTGAANYGAAAVITGSEDHLLAVGDLVTYEAQSDPGKISGLVSGHTYKVASVPATNTFTLTDTDDTAVTYGQASGNADHDFDAMDMIYARKNANSLLSTKVLRRHESGTCTATVDTQMITTTSSSHKVKAFESKSV